MSFPLMISPALLAQSSDKAKGKAALPVDEDFLLLLAEMDIPQAAKPPVKNDQSSKPTAAKSATNKDSKEALKTQQQRQQKIDQWLFWLEQEIPVTESTDGESNRESSSKGGKP